MASIEKFIYLRRLSEALKARRLQYAEELLSVAENEIGVSENGGSSDIARIKQYHNSTGDARGSGEGTPWCSSFVNWVLETTGNTGTDSAWAQGWKSWGIDAGGPVLGALAVFKNVKGGGHVGFVAGVATDGTLRILGGNQSDRVKYSNFNPNGSTLKIIAFRVPNIPNRALIAAPVVGGQAGNESTR